jgi:hypothetical protein
MAPPSAPAKNRNIAVCKFKQIFYHDSRPRSTQNAIGTANLHDADPPSQRRPPRTNSAKSFLDKPPRSVYVRSVS